MRIYRYTGTTTLLVYTTLLFGTTSPSFRSIRPTSAFASLPSRRSPATITTTTTTTTSSTARTDGEHGFGGTVPTGRRRTFLQTTTGAITEDPDGGGGVVPTPRRRRRPYLAVITEPDACDDDVRAEETFQTIRRAVSTGGVDLVSVRVTNPRRGDDDDDVFRERLVELTRRIVSFRDSASASAPTSAAPPFLVMVNDDVSAAVAAGADGVHVKEHKASSIPSVRRRLLDGSPAGRAAIGTSAHTLASARAVAAEHHPDYLFVGTCYLTRSHPEKAAEGDLEGPSLPGEVAESLRRDAGAGGGDGDAPVVYAIGGIDADNCREPVVRYGADGVAVIGAVMRAEDPGGVVRSMTERMAVE